MAEGKFCPVCGRAMHPIKWGYAVCNNCKYMSSNAEADSGAPVEGVEAVRKKNFTTICAFIKQNFPHCNTVLDVGCSKGLFLDIARVAGLTPTGLEPDAKLAEHCRAKGFDVLDGFFPGADALSSKRYDIIIFNDSFEHIPDPQRVIKGVTEHLHPEHGIVIINLPTSEGLMFQSALLLMKLGIRAPFDRIWQKSSSSPHLHGFNKHNLRMLLEKNGFTQRYSSPFPFYTVKGLWRRLTCQTSFALSLVSWTALILLYPLFRLKSDCFVSYFLIGNSVQGQQTGGARCE
jgi:SAM-dependent methyltransferase